MSAAGPVFVTPHAVARFRERIAPLPENLARAVIIQGVPRACAWRRGVRRDGRPSYDLGIDDGRYQFVVTVVPAPDPALLPVAVTVLSASKGRGRPHRWWDQAGWRRLP